MARAAQPILDAEALSCALAREGSVFLDTARRDPDTVSDEGLLFAGPSEILEARVLADVPELLEDLDAAVRRGRWVAGFLAYEAGYAFEPDLFEATQGGPFAWFGVYDEPVPASLAQPAASDVGGGAGITNMAFGLDRDEYSARVSRIRELIRAGEVYQINLTMPLTFDFSGDPRSLYSRVRSRQRVPYGAFLHLGETRILSFSPELFFRTADGRIVARPMKGTLPRHSSASAEALRNDEKNRAENLMIVDLLRNDLSRICLAGSVEAPGLFNVERYETVFQMTSTITGLLSPGVSLGRIFEALFPCGSVTGAPKIRAMQFIRALEDGPRGVYCGAVGFSGPGGVAAFNVPIRTVHLAHRTDGSWRGTMGVGSGVVWDSDPAAEFDECLAKARFLTGF